MKTVKIGLRGLGVDVAEISRFKSIRSQIKRRFLVKTFSKLEIAYCLEHKDSAPHFAGIFAAKEAASKALGTAEYPFIELEVRHDLDGRPEIWSKEKKLSLHISISHSAKMAVAIAAF
ncbi:MAG: holo-ACP synthase [Candidatus Paceibacterota bacterium]|jgi:holo-[acyl-carrier protein] synthase